MKWTLAPGDPDIHAFHDGQLAWKLYLSTSCSSMIGSDYCDDPGATVKTYDLAPHQTSIAVPALSPGKVYFWTISTCAAYVIHEPSYHQLLNGHKPMVVSRVSCESASPKPAQKQDATWTFGVSNPLTAPLAVGDVSSAFYSTGLLQDADPEEKAIPPRYIRCKSEGGRTAAGSRYRCTIDQPGTMTGSVSLSPSDTGATAMRIRVHEPGYPFVNKRVYADQICDFTRGRGEGARLQTANAMLANANLGTESGAPTQNSFCEITPNQKLVINN